MAASPRPLRLLVFLRLVFFACRPVGHDVRTVSVYWFLDHVVHIARTARVVLVGSDVDEEAYGVVCCMLGAGYALGKKRAS